MEPLIECIPNFSEGVNETVIARIADAIASVPQQKILHTDAGASANRTVFTFAGTPEAVAEAAFRAIKTAAEHIDMRTQQGAHPRIGATDVCPFVPLRDMTMNETVQTARQLAGRVGRELKIPVFLYEFAARKFYRRFLPDIRKGGYEHIIEKMQLPDWHPDYGPLPDADTIPAIERTGATIIGARKILIAFNISLDTRDEHIAQKIAGMLRSSGRIVKDGHGHRQQIPGLFPALRCIGWMMPSFGHAQVSMNFLDYRTTSPLEAFIACRELAHREGVDIKGCELVGLIPKSCILEAGLHALGGQPDTEPLLMQAGIHYLGLNNIKPFDPQKQVLEYVLEQKGLVKKGFQPEAE